MEELLNLDGKHPIMRENDTQRCILIVDNEEDLTWSISKALEKNDQHFAVVCAPNGDAALEVLSHRAVDIVISDIRMPGRDGLQLLEDIHRDYPGTKVIIMTAYGSHEVHDEICERGAAFYLEKPFEIRYLRKLIYEALDLEPMFWGNVMESRNGFDRLAFNGRVELQPQLREMIETHCVTGRSSTMTVLHGLSSGVIHFNNGDIIHAECGDLVGENAFYNILNWKTGRISLNPLDLSGKRTILRGWRSLLYSQVD